MIVRASLFGFLLLLAGTGFASDRQREQDYAAVLQQGPVVGQIEWLNVGDEKFLGLFVEAERTDNSNAVIILHDAGDYPDHQPLIRALRTTLPQHGWNSLALQMPLREVGAALQDYYPLFDAANLRVKAAADYLRAKGARNIAVIGYGMGGAMACYSLAKNSNLAGALVLISLALPEINPDTLKLGEFFTDSALPTLDLYAEYDLLSVMETARQRRLLAKTNPVFRQVEISGENHSYLNDPGLLVKRIYSWLATIASEK